MHFNPRSLKVLINMRMITIKLFRYLMFPCSFSYTVFGGGGLEETLQEKMVKGVICAVLL